MSVLQAPYTLAERLDFGYLVSQLINEDKTYNTGAHDLIKQIIADNSYRRNDEIALRDWYRGTGAPINNRVLKKGDMIVTNKINAKVQHNYLKRLTRIRTGYLGGNPVKYTLNSDYYNGSQIDDAFHAVNTFIKQSNLNDMHSETISDCTLYGHSGRLLYIDNAPFSKGGDPTILAMHVHGYDCIFLASCQWWIPELSIRYITDDVIEVYDNKYIHTVNIDSGATTSVLHEIGYNPLIPYINNSDMLGNMEDCLSKINDIDEQRSNLSSLLTQLRLVLKIFKDVDIDAETVEQTEQMGYIKLKTNEDGKGDVYFETLTIDSVATEKHIEELDRSVYLDSGIINMDSKQFGNESGEAKKYYLISMESNCVDTESKFRASDYIMWGIVSTFYNRINVTLDPDSIIANWIRNLPNAVLDEVKAFAAVYGKVSDETAFALLSFVAEPLDEIERAKSNIIAPTINTGDVVNE